MPGRSVRTAEEALVEFYVVARGIPYDPAELKAWVAQVQGKLAQYLRKKREEASGDEEKARVAAGS